MTENDLNKLINQAKYLYWKLDNIDDQSKIDQSNLIYSIFDFWSEFNQLADFQQEEIEQKIEFILDSLREVSPGRGVHDLYDSVVVNWNSILSYSGHFGARRKMLSAAMDYGAICKFVKEVMQKLEALHSDKYEEVAYWAEMYHIRELKREMSEMNNDVEISNEQLEDELTKSLHVIEFLRRFNETGETSPYITP
jgi:DNA repair ATPase RecN